MLYVSQRLWTKQWYTIDSGERNSEIKLNNIIYLIVQIIYYLVQNKRVVSSDEVGLDLSRWQIEGGLVTEGEEIRLLN